MENERISQAGSENTNPTGTSLIEGETSDGASEFYQLANVYKAFKSTLDTLYASIADAYSDEKAQDAVGSMIADTTTIDLTYTDATPELKADVKSNSITAGLLSASASAILFGRSTAGAGAGEEIAQSTFAVAAKGVTNGDSHDHSGGDGAQIDHGGLAGLTDDDHTQYIKHALATAANDMLAASGSGAFVKKTPTEFTALLDAMVGDSGAGGTKGLVPAPAAGDASKAFFGDGTYKTIPGGGDALTTNPLSQFAATTSLQLAGVISDETGSGALVFGTSPTIATPTLTLKQSAAPAPTAEGDIQWDTDDNKIKIGDGASTKTFSDDSVQVLKADVDDTAVNGATTDPISSNWAYDHENLTAAHGATGANVGTTNTQTLTNKRVTARVTSITSSATPTINTDNCDAVDITALAADITSMTTNLSGTPLNFDKLIIRFKDNGTARAITWGASFEACGVALPTTTVVSKRLTVGLLYDATSSKWGCVASAQEE